MKKWTAVLVVLICGSLSYAYFGEIRKLVEGYLLPLEVEPVPTLVVSRRDFEVEVLAHGELSGFNTTALRAPQILDGSLKIEWMIDEGTIVSPGQVVVRFDSSDALLRLESNENAVSIYNHNIRQARTDFESEIRLLDLDQDIADLELDFSESQIRKDEDIFSRWEIEESIISAALVRYKKMQLARQREMREGLSEADLEILRIGKRQANAEVQIAQQTLDSLEMVAPGEGVILNRRTGLNQLQEGSEVWSGQSILDLATLRQYKARLFVFETEIVGVQVGQPVDVRVRAIQGHRFEGKLQKISTAPQQISRSDPRRYFLCDVLLEVPLEHMDKLKPGIDLTGRIQLGYREDALIVPKSAVIREESSFAVYVRQGDDYLRREVQILDGDYAFYQVEGVVEGEEVCLRHPDEQQQLHLPDFNSPTLTTRRRQFVTF